VWPASCKLGSRNYRPRRAPANAVNFLRSQPRWAVDRRSDKLPSGRAKTRKRAGVAAARSPRCSRLRNSWHHSACPSMRNALPKATSMRARSARSDRSDIRISLGYRRRLLRAIPEFAGTEPTPRPVAAAAAPPQDSAVACQLTVGHQFETRPLEKRKKLWKRDNLHLRRARQSRSARRGRLSRRGASPRASPKSTTVRSSNTRC
jgi:hypothetical protein